MPLFSRPVTTSLFVALVATTLLTSCERRGHEKPSKVATPDPRVTKNFSSAAPWFCEVPYEYSKSEDGKPDQVVRGVVVAAGENKKSAYEVLNKTCGVEPEAKASPSPKSGKDADKTPPTEKEEIEIVAIANVPQSQCREILAAKTEKCIGASLIVSAPPTTGIWSCEMKFTVESTEETLSVVGHTTANAAIGEAFVNCAALKDAEIGSTKRRDACSRAMMDRKLVCKDANAGVTTPPKAATKRKLNRTTKKKSLKIT